MSFANFCASLAKYNKSQKSKSIKIPIFMILHNKSVVFRYEIILKVIDYQLDIYHLNSSHVSLSVTDC